MAKWWFLWMAALVGCAHQSPLEQKFETAAQGETSPSELMRGHQATAVFYLSPECPLCRNYTVTIKNLQRKYAGAGIGFFGVVSGTFYSRKQVENYLLKYNMDLEILMDPTFAMSEYYGATTTPEAHLLDANGKAVYRGAIDNWAISLGQKRRKATAHYLSDAIDHRLAGQPIDPDKTEAVGCYIE